MFLIIAAALAIIVIFLVYFWFKRAPSVDLLKFNDPYMIDGVSLVNILLDLHEPITEKRDITLNLVFEGEKREPLVSFVEYFSTNAQRTEVVSDTVVKEGILELKLACFPNV